MILDFGALAGMHLQQSADTLSLVLGRHVDRIARIERAGIDAEEGQIANEGVVQNLESKRREGFCITGGTRIRLTIAIGAFDRRHLDR